MKYLYQLSRMGLLSIILFSVTNLALAQSEEKLLTVTMGSDLYNSFFSKGYKGHVLDSDGIHLVRVPSSKIEEISDYAHENFNRCGGLMVHNDLQSGEEELFSTGKRKTAQKGILETYSITRESLVKSLLPKVNEGEIADVIRKLSSFKNRYYKSSTGVDSQNWLFSHWSKFAQGRSDISVSRFEHDGWPQDTILATIEGNSNERIIIGGHADSIAGWWGRERATAPGADDNASGIATLTEILRIASESGYRPEHTIVFAAYAAEEVGLLGSKELARSYSDEGLIVKGVLQLDMTNYNGSEKDILLVSDYTNEEQNRFLGNLIDSYLPELTWGYTACGYACSDHASWTSEGFPASSPFEAEKGDMNRNIHSSRDTISQSGDNALHAQKFARLGLAYLIELDK